MRTLGILFSIVTTLVFVAGSSSAQSIGGFPCVGTVAAPHYCASTGSTTVGFRGYSGSLDSYATVAGYVAPGDGGGGDYAKLGAAGTYCNSYTAGQVSGTGVAGQSKITGLAATPGNTFVITTLRVGEVVTGSGVDTSGGTVQVQPGTEIARKNLGSE